jgi:membrane-bound lytic murein transglycosylase B
MKKLTLILSLLFFYFHTSASLAIDLGSRPDIQTYIQNISQKYNFEQAQLTNWFNQTDFLEVTVSKVHKPSKPKPFYIYRDALMTPERIKSGAAYWKEHKKALLSVEKRYGVPPEIMLGILGIETGYGVNTGHYSAFQGLITLAFNHPSRRPYFTSELTNYLLLCREQGWDPLSVRSSFDGGLGLPQFMPSSYREYAISANDSEQPNLFEDDDTIVSMGNYLHRKGWQAEKPIVVPAKIIDGKSIYPIPPEGVPALLTLAELKQRYGVVPRQNLPDDLKAGILALQNEHGLEYWLFFQNFLVIKKYNNSTNYAMTVYSLGKAALHKKVG